MSTKENAALKKSLFDLSAKYNLLANKISPSSSILSTFSSFEPYDPLEQLDTPEITSDLTSPREKKDGKSFYFKSDIKGHVGAVYSVAFSQCGRFLASGSFDKSVRIWDPFLSKELFCLKKHSNSVSDLAWSNDSKLLLSGGYDQTCKLWNVETGKFMDSFDAEGFVQCVAFDPKCMG